MTTAMVPTSKPSWSELKDLALWAAQSKQVKGVSRPEQAMLRIKYGMELGLGPAAALQSVFVVGDVPSLKANTIAALIQSSGRYLYRVLKLTDTECQLAFFDKLMGTWEKAGEYSFTLEDAQKAGLTKNATYRQYPRAMLFSRCLTAGARVYCPDCLGGIVPYTPDEVGQECDSEGTPVYPETAEVIDAEWSEHEPADQITEEEFQQLLADANAKQMQLGNVIGNLGGDPSDLRGMTRGQYEAARQLIGQK